MLHCNLALFRVNVAENDDTMSDTAMFAINTSMLVLRFVFCVYRAVRIVILPIKDKNTITSKNAK